MTVKILVLIRLWRLAPTGGRPRNGWVLFHSVHGCCVQAARTMAGATLRSFVERFQSPVNSPPEHSCTTLSAAETGIAAKPAGPPPASSSGAAQRHDSSGGQLLVAAICSRIVQAAQDHQRFLFDSCSGHPTFAQNSILRNTLFSGTSENAVAAADAAKESLSEAKAAERSPFEAFHNLPPDLRITIGSPPEVELLAYKAADNIASKSTCTQILALLCFTSRPMESG